MVLEELQETLKGKLCVLCFVAAAAHREQCRALGVVCGLSQSYVGPMEF